MKKKELLREELLREVEKEAVKRGGELISAIYRGDKQVYPK
jgi:hypothetical protein